MCGLNNHYQSNRLKRSANPKTPMNTLSPLKPFVTDKTIAIPTDNTPIKLQGFNVFNFSNHLIFKFNNKLTKPIDQCITFAFSATNKKPHECGALENLSLTHRYHFLAYFSTTFFTGFIVCK